MDTRRFQGCNGKQVCDATLRTLSELSVHDHSLQEQRPASSPRISARCDNSELKLIPGFDDDGDWSDDHARNDPASSAPAAEGKEQELRCTSVTPQATEMEVTVSPLVRSIFQNRKKSILDANHKSLRKEHGSRSGAAQSQGSQKDRADAVEDYETMLQRKVQALDEEVAIFKKESERLKKLAKEHEEGLARLAREKAEWEEQKKSQMQAFQAQQEQQIEKLKKEKQILDHRSATLHNLPAVQRREVEELKETLAKEQEDHHGKELRLRLTIKRLRAMNEDLTKQVLETHDEIRRYESVLLSAMDGRENGLHATVPLSKRARAEANHKHCTCSGLPKQPTPAQEEEKGAKNAGHIAAPWKKMVLQPALNCPSGSL